MTKLKILAEPVSLKSGCEWAEEYYPKVVTYQLPNYSLALDKVELEDTGWAEEMNDFMQDMYIEKVRQAGPQHFMKSVADMFEGKGQVTYKGHPITKTEVGPHVFFHFFNKYTQEVTTVLGGTSYDSL